MWEPRQKFPKAIRDYVATEFNGKIYVTGGIDGSNNYSHQLYCYDPNTNLWTEKCTLFSINSKNPAFITTKHSLYAVGNNKAVYQYDATRDIWTVVSVMPFYVYIFAYILSVTNYSIIFFPQFRLGTSTTFHPSNAPSTMVYKFTLCLKIKDSE